VGIRSDSDLYTFGYSFKPWTGNPIASGGAILGYLEEAIEDDQLDQHIRYQHEVQKTSWSSEEQVWLITVLRKDTGDILHFSCNFLWMCQGYYRHDHGYTPEWEGMGDFKGPVVHPQIWPKELDYAGKRVLVIGSGATAATLIPNMAFMFGYLRTSWTIRVDLVSDYICKLLNHMESIGAASCTPTLRHSRRDRGRSN